MTTYDAILAETVRITGHEGTEIAAYLARPLEPGPVPGVLVIHHMPGLGRGLEGDHAEVRGARILGDLPSPALPGRSGREPRRRRRRGSRGGRSSRRKIPRRRRRRDPRPSRPHLFERQGRRDRLLLGRSPVLPGGLQPPVGRGGRLLRGVRREHAARGSAAQV